MTYLEVLIVDRQAVARFSDTQPRGFLERCDQRQQTCSTLPSGRLKMTAWYVLKADWTIAGSTPDRLLHNADRIELTGESLRKQTAAKGLQAGE